MLNHIDYTRDKGLEVRIVHADATLAVPWQIEHDYFFAAFLEAVEKRQEVVSCLCVWVGGGWFWG